MAGAALVLVGAFGSYLQLLQPAWKVASASRWEPQPCVILDSRVVESDGLRPRDHHYRPEILYSYQVDGAEYKSSQYGFFKPFLGLSSGSEAAVAQHPVGSTAECYVNPADPTEAVLDRGFNSGIIFGLFCLAIFGGGLVTLCRALQA